MSEHNRADDAPADSTRQADVPDHADATDIAVVGIAGRFPDAETPDEFWENLRQGRLSARTYTDDELRERGVPEGLLANPNYVRSGVPLDRFAEFDAEFFGLGPKDAAIMDPQHRQLLEVAWESLESAGHPPESFEGDIGVFAGCGMSAYFLYNIMTNPELVNQVGVFLLRHTSNDKDFLATRVSYALNLTGPSVSVQTACSTSLVAIHQACQSLLQYECDMALAGGVTIEMPHGVGYVYKEGEPLSPDGACRAFDHRSEGTVFGSGAGMVTLRRLGDAITDGDIIYGVIKGSAVNNDGSAKVSYLAPSVDGQAAAVAEALAVADVDPDTVQYIECHGTGTPMGDPIEVAALNQAYGSAGGPATISIGSVKPNIGHLDTAAGVASFIKLVQALRHREIPPSANFEAPNPTIDFAGGPFVVNNRLREWPDTGAVPARGGVSSLGVGGTNAHVVVEEPVKVDRPSGPSRRRAQLLMVSGRNKNAVADNTERLRARIGESDDTLADVAFSLHTTRQHFDVRRTAVARDRADAVAKLASDDAADLPTRQIFHERASAAFLFPGGGSQYVQMGRELYEHEPVYREHLDAGLARLRDVHDVDLQPLLFPDPINEDEAAKKLGVTEVALAAIFITEYALAQLYLSLGVQPRVMAGHSMGQVTAACIAGVLSYDDALDLVVLRGELIDETGEGGVLSVNLDPEAIEPYLSGTLALASVNAPGLCVVSGTADEIRALTEVLRQDEVEIREIPLNSAAHSPLFDPVLERFAQKWRTVELSPPSIPIACNLEGGWLTDSNATDPDYWVRHFRHTVRFADNVESLLEQAGTVLLEVGPGRSLSSFARQSEAIAAQQPVLSSMRHVDQDGDDDLFFLDSVGRLWAAGISIDAAQLYRGEQRRRVELPFYAFQHQEYYIEPGDAVVVEGNEGASLRRGEDLSDWFWEPVWHEEPASGGASLPDPSRWLVFCDGAGVGTQLIERLRRDGHEVITVAQADMFSRVDDRTYRLAPEQGRVGYDELAMALVADDKMPDRVLHLWSLTDSKRVRAGSSWFHHVQERGFLSLVHLAQAMTDQDPTLEQRWTVVTNGAQPVRGAVTYPEKATLFGPVSVIPHEFPGVSVAAIDVELPNTKSSRTPTDRALAAAERLIARAQGREAAAASGLSDVVGAVLADLAGADDDAIIGYRDGHRYVRSFDRTVVEPAGKGHLKQGGTYLVTGGLGGIAMSLGDRLARKWKANLVLVSRTELPPRDAWEAWLTDHGPGNAVSKRLRKLLALEEAGVEVMVARADVADLSAMETVVADAIERFGRIDGVLHTAGVVHENLIALKDEREIDAVLTPKVQGAMVLDQVFEPYDLDFVLYFSSTSTALGIPGQVDYAAANAFLDAYARRPRLDKDPATLSLAWGPWREVGMAAAANAQDLAGSFQPADHPLLDYVSVDDDDIVATLELSVADTWVLDEHRAGAGRAILPGTGHLELLVSTALEGGAEAVEVANLSFLDPLMIPDNVVRDARVTLTPSAAGHTAEIVTSALGSSGGWRTHSQATVHMLDVAETEMPVVGLDAIRARCSTCVQVDEAGIVTKQENHIQFGPRWRNLRSIAWGRGEALAEIRLPDDYVADVDRFNLHPAMLDMATGYGLPLLDGYDDLDEVPLYVPMSYGSVRWYAPLGATFFSHVRFRDAAAGGNLVRFDITLVDADGRVLVDIENFAVVKVDDSADFADESQQSTALGTVGRVSSPEVMFERFLEAGIEPDDGWIVFERLLEAGADDHVFVSPLPIQGMIDLITDTLGRTDEGAKFARPDLASEFAEPTDEIERNLVSMWEELLGVDPIGIDDDFFELGGHSLIALRLFATMKQRFGVDHPMSLLFDAPTIAKLATVIRDQIGAAPAGSETTDSARSAAPSSQLRHVVQIAPDPGEGRDPLFLVAGMFGNILNLRYLAKLVGQDRAVYGIQARGLSGDEQPHETFEEAAADYLAEIKEIQPEGPYFVGGFSGGGFKAYEIAQQLTDAGEDVAMVILLDTPLPGYGGAITRSDKMLMKLQDLQRFKHKYPAMWLRKRIEFEREQRRVDTAEVLEDHEVRSSAIEEGFMRALARYEPRRWAGTLHIYRPRLNKLYKLGGEDRYIDDQWNFQLEDNGWTGWVDEVQVREVPGNHDSMVLEPNVRVLAARVVEDIATVQAALDAN